MKQLFCGLLCMVIIFAGLCQVKQNDACPYLSAASIDILSQRWVNTFTEIYDNGQEASYRIHPVGYFQLNANKTYNRLSNGIALNGKWSMSANCQLVLDLGTALHRDFDIIKLTADSLTIRRQESDRTYIQHYKALPQQSFVMAYNLNKNLAILQFKKQGSHGFTY